MAKSVRQNQVKINFPFTFSDGVFEEAKRYFYKKENPKDLIDHLSHRIAGYKGEITKLKKQIKK